MKSAALAVALLFAGLAFSGSAPAAEPARLALWITDPIGNSDGRQCDLTGHHAAGQAVPERRPTLTERDVGAWRADSARWTLHPTRIPVPNQSKLTDRCFVLALDGKKISGVVLSSHSARLTMLPTISIYTEGDALELQLTSGNHGRDMWLIHVDALDAVLGGRARLERQLQRLNENDGHNPQLLDREWTAAIRHLIDRKQIRPGMQIAEVIRHLGQPSGISGPAENRIYRWYFNTPMHVNSVFVVKMDGDVVREYSFGRG